MESNSLPYNLNSDLDKKEQVRSLKIGVAVGSGGVYSAAGLGVLEVLEQNGFNIPYIGGASGGALISAVYFLEGNAISAQEKFLQKLPDIHNIKLSPFGKPMSGNDAREVVKRILDDRDWNDGKTSEVCFGVAYQDTQETVVLTKDSGISLVDSVLASVSLKMIEPIVKLNGRTIAHGGDPQYIEGLKNIGADFVIDVSPNLEKGVIGKMAHIANSISAAIILKGDQVSSQKTAIKNADFSIGPNLNLKPFISPLNYSLKNTEFMIAKGRELTHQHIIELRSVTEKQFFTA